MVGRPLRRFATAGSGMVAGRTDGRSGPPKTASFVVEKAAEGGGQNSNETRRAIERASERARVGIGMNGYFGNLMEPSSLSLSLRAVRSVGGRRIFSIIRPRQARSICCRGTTARPTAAANDDSGEGSDIRVRSFVRGSLSLQRY